jgi:hypothetical protein
MFIDMSVQPFEARVTCNDIRQHNGIGFQDTKKEVGVQKIFNSTHYVTSPEFPWDHPPTHASFPTLPLKQSAIRRLPVQSFHVVFFPLRIQQNPEVPIITGSEKSFTVS